MKRSLTFLGLMGLLTGCVPTRQAARVGGSAHPTLSLCDDRYVLVGIDMNREKLIAERSRIVAPSGKLYTVQVEPHQYDIDQKLDAIRADVYPCDADGARIRRWSNGIWSFHFVVEAADGMPQAIDQQWKFWTFYYNPILHGPPNE